MTRKEKDELGRYAEQLRQDVVGARRWECRDPAAKGWADACLAVAVDLFEWLSQGEPLAWEGFDAYLMERARAATPESLWLPEGEGNPPEAP